MKQLDPSNNLYRGVNEEMYRLLRGQLRPKQATHFSRSPEFGRDEWGNCFWGDSPLNAVVEHQRHQAGYPTSGVSFTPHLERAYFYATCGGKHQNGYIYTVKPHICHTHSVQLFVVNDIVPQPSVIHDDEVILVASDFGTLPSEIIINVIRINGHDDPSEDVRAM